MKNKVKDVFYCGVREDVIKNAKPVLNEKNVERFYNWFSERYKIHLKKDVLLEKGPWTSDLILRKYRFTNVRREHDRETKWLIKNICFSDLSYKNKLLNCILFRLFNKSETLEIFGLQDFGNFRISEISRKVKNYRKENPNYVFFSNAFFTSGPKTAGNKLFGKDDIVVNIFRLVESYFLDGLVPKISGCINQRQVFDVLRGLKGIGDFLAYQIFVDFTYIPEFPFSENEFVVAGPGCKKGLKLIFEDLSGLNFEEALFWLRDNQFEVFGKFGYDPDKLFSDLLEYDRTLNVMSLENCMCEISKYIRALEGAGRPRVKYKFKS